MTAGITGIALSTITQQPLPGRFTLTVLSAEGNTAVVLANGKALEVRSEIPLQPGQTLIVSQEQGTGGEIRLRLLGTAPTSEVSTSQAPKAASQIDLQTALQLAELPASVDPSKVAALLKMLGGDLSLPNLLAAAAFLKTGLASDQALQAVASFLNSLLGQQEKDPDNTAADNSSAQALKQAVLPRLQELANNLQSLSGQPGGEQKLDAILQALVAKGGDPGKQAVGGQVFTWTQTDQDKPVFFYLPLHTILNDYGLRNCELYICPPGSEQSTRDQDAWLFTLTLETEALGWMQFKLACQGRQVSVQAMVEQPATKLALDGNWPLLAAGLDSLNLKLTSQQCELGPVPSQARSLRDLGRSFRQYNPFDVSI
jgi:hypothetical protein